MPKMGLVLQGGGALGAYEYGAVTRLVELGGIRLLSPASRFQPLRLRRLPVRQTAISAKVLNACGTQLLSIYSRFGLPSDKRLFPFLAIRAFGACGTTFLVI